MEEKIQTLSIGILNDLRFDVRKDYKFENIKDIKKILKEVFNDNDFTHHSCEFFDSDSNNDRIITEIYKSLKARDYCVYNRYNKYYVIAFSINNAKFWIWSKDYDAKLIPWTMDSPKDRIVGPPPPKDYGVSPVALLINQLFSKKE